MGILLTATWNSTVWRNSSEICLVSWFREILHSHEAINKSFLQKQVGSSACCDNIYIASEFNEQSVKKKIMYLWKAGKKKKEVK